MRGFKAIIDGEMDEYPEAAFFNVGTIEDVKKRAEQLAAEELDDSGLLKMKTFTLRVYRFAGTFTPAPANRWCSPRWTAWWAFWPTMCRRCMPSAPASSAPP